MLQYKNKILKLSKILAIAIIAIGILAIGYFLKKKNLSIQLILSIGSFLLVSSLIELINNFFIKPSEMIEVRSHLQEVLINTIDNNYLTIKDDINYAKIINSSTSIDLTNSNLKDKSDVDMIYVHFDKKFLNTKSIEKLIKYLKNNSNVKLNLLILDPTNIFILERGRTLKREAHSVTYFKKHEKLKKLFDELEKNGVNTDKCINVRVYNDYPSIVYLRFGNKAWFTPLWTVDTAVDQPFIEVNLDKESSLKVTIEENFKKLWEKSFIYENHRLFELLDLGSDRYLKFLKIKDLISQKILTSLSFDTITKFDTVLKENKIYSDYKIPNLIKFLQNIDDRNITEEKLNLNNIISLINKFEK